MIIPHKLENLISQNPDLVGYVTEQINSFIPWIEASGTPFFTNYTDHGIHHLSRVLNLCEWLIDQESWKTLNPEDGACLIFSVLLHDLAMHMTPDSFRELISNNDGILISHFDQKPWILLWSEYLDEIQNWEDSTWINNTGESLSDDQTGWKSIDINNLKEADLPLIGEFIRRHHIRLAHEFTITGVPTSSSEQLKYRKTEKFQEIVEISGLVARSHGLSLRDTYNYLDDVFFGRVQVFSTHPVFLMSILRVADYLDLQAERAPHDLLKVKTILSPFSRGEWAAHQAIREIRYNVDADPEKIEIIAKPQNAFSYQRIIGWINGIQKELDHSWSVLGETYGRFKEYSSLKIRIRRISSPIQDKEFSKKQDLDFIPTPVRLDVDASKLINVLIEPLYGNAPEVAVREMLQNSIDAVKELDCITPLDKESIPLILRKYDCDILVTICKSEDG